MEAVVVVPDLLVGFDIESTGLDTRSDEPISYGFAEFRFGRLVRTEQFFVLPDVQIHPGAEKIHGVSFEHLRKWRREGIALSSRAGASRATQRLIDYSMQGATFVGANPMFDYSMLDCTLRRQAVGDLKSLGLHTDEISIVDVVSNDKLLDSDRTSRPRRGLSSLCEFYGVTPGEHDAAQDARASCEVLIAQVHLARLQLRSLTYEPPRACVDERSGVPNRSSWLRRTFLNRSDVREGE